MAPNPIMIPRKPVPRHGDDKKTKRTLGGMAVSALTTSLMILLFSSLAWARRWFWSGAAIESLLLIYGWETGQRILPYIPLWTVLSTLNVIYAVCSTSWLLHVFFSVACWPLLFITCLSQFPIVSDLARRTLRKTLREYPSHFIRDKIALFNLPALEIDTDVDGLMVIRAVTFSLSSLSLVAHGIEIGIKLANDIELAIYVDEVTVNFFRRIDIGDVYANVKGGNAEMTFGAMDDPVDDSMSETSIFIDDTPLLRAASIGAAGLRDRPKLRESLTGGVSYMADSSPQKGFEGVRTLSPDEELADKKYQELMTEIRTTSAIYQSRASVRQKAKTIIKGFTLDNEKDLRAAICAELHAVPSISHPPKRSVKVTTLQTMSSESTRRFLHRLPFLLRALLSPLSYFHPIGIASINAAGSGHWVSALLQQKVFRRHTEHNMELRKLWRRLSEWLKDANFCFQLADIEALGQVPWSTSFDIVAFLKANEVVAYRTAPRSGTISPVVRLGGVDATFTIPSFLLPHHEHIIPPPPTAEDERQQAEDVAHADGLPKIVQAERTLESLKKDETSIIMSVHGSLPASCDQSLLNFVASLVKATKIIELEKDIVEKDVDEVESPDTASEDASISPVDSVSEASNVSIKGMAGAKIFAKNIRNNLKDGLTKEAIKDFARDLHSSTRDGMKRGLVTGLVNDRWIAKIVGRTAAMLQKAQGDVGYSGSIPIPLDPYRHVEENWAAKLLP
ncbi:hypothetical protein TI39_contig4155g00003 [Zymoseptoria brevis]|uniref:Uncharacterized protein n=1 Tax=Zymoseptoria brevis TaxID=1047168 RepID=A0A0F4GCV2_9PEZI|nr:hypothetical protein TI39_contig4155g00003 [Zymoseptoria brevis]